MAWTSVRYLTSCSDMSVGLGRLVLRQAGQRRVVLVEVGGRAQGLVVGLGRAVFGGRRVLGNVGVLRRDRRLHAHWRTRIRRTASGASRTATSRRTVWTPRMNVVLAFAPKAIASTA